MILTVTLPFFALVLFGYIAASRRWVPPEAVPAGTGGEVVETGWADPSAFKDL